MRDRIARLRVWLAGGAVLLTVVIVAFIAYGRYISHLRHIRLPLPPGVNIVREAGGWTYSHSNGSRTDYTIHAATGAQGRNGKTALHDVSVVLFGKNGDRRDRISGQDFEYDESGGVLRALGLVHVDLESAAAPKTLGQNGESTVVQRQDGAQHIAPDVMHVTTSGLIYLVKLGIAATSEDVDLQAGEMKGHARGADYSSDSGLLMLHSAISIDGISGGHAVRVTAAQAQFDERSQQARLSDATFQSQGRAGSAARAVLHRRADGTLEELDAEGAVTLGDQRGKAVAPRAQIHMNAAGKPASALLAGGVVYTSDQPLRQVRSAASEASFAFAPNGKVQLNHAVFSGGVHMVERTRLADGSSSHWSSRDLSGARIEAWLAPGSAGRMQLHNAQATGNAKLILLNQEEPRRPDATTRTEVAGDTLKATMPGSGSRLSLDDLSAQGHTSLAQLSGSGIEQTSAGDTLDAKFSAPKPASPQARAAAPSTLSDQIVSAVQQGHVTMTRRVPPGSDSSRKPAPEQVQHAVADRAAYDGLKHQVLLSGAVRVSDSGDAMWARQVMLDRVTGDADAAGPVKVDYAQEAGAEPMHILAERAEVNHAKSSATFFGRPVRVWQNGNQVQAPEVLVEKLPKRLTARGSATIASSEPANSLPVRTMLVNAPPVRDSGKQAAAAPARCGTGQAVGTGQGTAKEPISNAVRISSGGLVYSGATHRVEFTGGVRADTADATVRAAQATAYLVDTREHEKPASASLDGGLEKMTASGQVEIARPGSHVYGEQLLYDALDRTFLLSGGPRDPAKAVDARGTGTAAAFRFSACDDTLEALSESPGAVKQKVESDAVASGPKREKAGR